LAAMEILGHSLWLLVGLALLYFGAEWLVKGSSELALRSGLSPLVVGLTVVAFGTSAPELLVSLQANLSPDTRADIAVGNVIGSNICNILLMLGIAALIRPLSVDSQVVKRELPILCVVSLVFVWMLWDRRI
jgi:cation:H+ antiporter